MIILIAIVAGLLISWGSSLSTIALDNSGSKRDVIISYVLSVLVISLAIFLVMLYAA